MTGDPEVAQDLVQKTFIDAHRGILASNSDLSLKAWIYRIATNNALQHLRRRRLISFLPFSRLGDAFTSNLRAISHEPIERIAIQEALLKVPVDQRTAMVLHFVEGFRYREIGELLGISEDAVRKRVARGSKRFRSAYGADPGGKVR